MEEEVKIKTIPVVGEKYHFFDDGKASPSRHYIAECNNVITVEEAKKVIVKCYEHEEKTLYDVWKIEKESCNWLYADETDVFVSCLIPVYDDYPIWFVRTKDGGWFSINVESDWQSGRLDVDAEIYNYYTNEYGEKYYGDVKIDDDKKKE